jgi:hypothetical protein
MVNMSGSGETPDDSQKPIKPLITPKRGAFPTPKSEIERATPYIPEDDNDEEDDLNGKPDLPTDADGEKRD